MRRYASLKNALVFLFLGSESMMKRWRKDSTQIRTISDLPISVRSCWSINQSSMVQYESGIETGYCTDLSGSSELPLFRAICFPSFLCFSWASRTPIRPAQLLKLVVLRDRDKAILTAVNGVHHGGKSIYVNVLRRSVSTSPHPKTG